MTKKFDIYLTEFEKLVCGTGLIFVTFLIFINVILRYFFNADLSWSSELVRYVMIFVSFIGASLCVRKGSHISIDFFINKVNGRKHKIVGIGINVVGLAFSIILVVLSVQLIYQNIVFPQSSPALQIPMFIPYMSIFIGFLLSSIRHIQLIFSDIASLKGVA